MLQVSNKSQTEFNLCLGGENEIEAKTLINTLDSTLELLNYVINKNNKDAFIKISIKGTKEGSFVVMLAALIAISSTLFTAENISLAKNSIDIVCGLLNLKQHLKGERPKTVEKNNEKVKIENIHGENVIINVNTYNLYNAQSDDMISKIFSTCTRDFYKINSKDIDLVSVQKEEYGNMTKQIEINAQDERVVYSTVITEMRIKKPDFTGNSQWDLTDENNRTFKTSFEDEAFIEKVHNAEISINSKTTITAELFIETTLNSYNVPIKDIHIVKKVLKVNKNDDSEQINFL